MDHADFVESPELFIKHTRERSFIGPSMLQLTTGEILMIANWGRPPTDFEQLAVRTPVPETFTSGDGGRTWERQGRMKMEWNLSGMISDGGNTLLRLTDGRIAFLSHRHVQGLHGGGVPIFSTSEDEGRTWAPPRLLDGEEHVSYVMNDRMVRMRSGRLVVPVAEPPSGTGEGYSEGAATIARCYLSDDNGETWQRSAGLAELPDDARGMAEPCVAEYEDGRLVMLARTGKGCHYRSWSDNRGDTWSEPEPTILTAACSPLTMRLLPDGRIIVLYNHAAPAFDGAFFPRNPLVYTVSGTGGRTWSDVIVIDDEGAQLDEQHLQHIYPGLCFTDEGILVIYSTHYADPKGTFGGPEDGWRIGGGKRCIIKYPG